MYTPHSKRGSEIIEGWSFSVAQSFCRNTLNQIILPGYPKSERLLNDLSLEWAQRLSIDPVQTRLRLRILDLDLFYMQVGFNQDLKSFKLTNRESCNNNDIQDHTSQRPLFHTENPSKQDYVAFYALNSESFLFFFGNFDWFPRHVTQVTHIVW